MRLLTQLLTMFWLAGAALGCAPVMRPAPEPGGKPAAVPPSAADGVEPAHIEARLAAALACPRALALTKVAVEAEVTCLLRQYLQLDTSNPPGNEGLTARFLQALLEREGVASQLLSPGPGRANLWARFPGRSRGHGLMLVHHMDVVPARARDWSEPPFGGTLKDGELWGRGSIDNKGGGIVQLVCMLVLKRLNVALEHDVILLAVADEEAGGGAGARWLLQEHPELFEQVQFVLNEGGAIVDMGAGPPLYSVERSQKAPLWLRLTASGPGGHGSSPSPEASTHVLLRALARLLEHEFPMNVLPAVQEMFAAQAQTLAPENRSRYVHLAASLEDPAFREAFLADPHHAALVRTTLAVTQLVGSDKENVLPSEAQAVLDLRLLPGQDAAQVVAELVDVMAEPSVQVQTLLSWPAHSSSLDTPLFAAIQRLAASQQPPAPVLARVIGGFTDCNAFRAAGMVCYGFMPIPMEVSSFARIHGTDERVGVAALAQGVLQLAALVQDFRPVAVGTPQEP